MGFHTFGRNFLGPMTAITAAGTPPMGSVFNAVPSADYTLGRDLPTRLPAMRARPARGPAVMDHPLGIPCQPCGCGA